MKSKSHPRRRSVAKKSHGRTYRPWQTNDKKVAKCTCREPKTHRDCTFCGSGVAIPEGGVCGICHEAGIDGPVIRGSGRVVCKLHKSMPLKVLVEAGKRALKEVYFPDDLKQLIGDDGRKRTKETSNKKLTRAQVCLKLDEATKLIDFVVAAIASKSAPTSVTEAHKGTLLDLSDRLANLSDDIFLSDD